MSNFTTFQTLTLMFLMLLGGKVFVLALELAYTRKFKTVVFPVSHSHDEQNKGRELEAAENHILLQIQEENDSAVKNPLDPPPTLKKSMVSRSPTSGRNCKSEGDVFARLREQRRMSINSKIPELQMVLQGTQQNNDHKKSHETDDPALKLQSQALRYYNYIVICYLIVVQLVGIILVIIYLNTNPDSQKPLRERGIDSTLFSVFITVSFFANCGYVQLNEGLVPFQQSPGLLWLLVIQMALGNTMFWPSVRLLTWGLSRLRMFTTGTQARALQYILNNPQKLLPFGFKQTMWIVMAEWGLNIVQLGFLSALQWNTSVFQGLTWTQRFSTAVFQTFSTRTTGINAVNMADLSPAIIFIYALVMYIPSEVGLKETSASSSSCVETKDEGNFLSIQIQKTLFQRSVALLAITVVICITENHNVVHDPINFSILNMIFETISAYGNVGLSVGYSCRLRRNEDGACEDVPYSLSGKWSVMGKLLLLPLMLLGRF
ncbi:cation transporter HKT2;1-like [Cryptomeria japonica]|uniref:cation transporter HKT2;1-like n=1 Tax=Cryptomeria japonica TaxID=3369 RepID=UPI0027DA527A|nr:cation transporter HKT2;1-like [Cryptomeria japonica]